MVYHQETTRQQIAGNYSKIKLLLNTYRSCFIDVRTGGNDLRRYGNLVKHGHMITTGNG